MLFILRADETGGIQTNEIGGVAVVVITLLLVGWPIAAVILRSGRGGSPS